MKILFICGSMEPGCDGVGDYLRRLSGELIRMGNEVAIIALKDRYIQNVLDSSQTVETFNLKVLRLPFSDASGLHEERVRKWINKFSPDFLSLQFVPFSFQRKGLFFGLNGYLRRISKGYRWHFMFHELWVGMATDSSMKLKVWGFIQRKMISSLIWKLKPALVHTNTKLYQQQLKTQGAHAIHLPLFSNISFTKNSGNMNSTEKNNGYSMLIGEPVYMVHFGLLHPGAPIIQFAREIKLYGKQKNLNFVLRIVGRSGNEQFNWKKVCEVEGLETEILGEQSFGTISEMLSSAAVGITTNPLALVEKSGSVAAMIEHNLPVLSVSKSWRAPKKIATRNPGGVLPFNLGNLQLSLDKKTVIHPEINTAKSVAEQFVYDLKSALK